MARLANRRASKPVADAVEVASPPDALLVGRAVKLASAVPVARAVELASAVPVTRAVELPSPPAAPVAVAVAADPEPEAFSCFFFSSAFFFSSFSFFFSVFSDAAVEVEFPADTEPEGFAWCFFFSVAVDVPADAVPEALAWLALRSAVLVFLLDLLEVVCEDEFESASRFKTIEEFEFGMAAPPVAGDRCGIPVELVEFDPPPVTLDVELVVEFAWW